MCAEGLLGPLVQDIPNRWNECHASPGICVRGRLMAASRSIEIWQMHMAKENSLDLLVVRLQRGLGSTGTGGNKELLGRLVARRKESRRALRRVHILVQSSGRERTGTTITAKSRDFLNGRARIPATYVTLSRSLLTSDGVMQKVTREILTEAGIYNRCPS